MTIYFLVMHKKINSAFLFKLIIIFIIIFINSIGIYANKNISIAYFTEKYPFIYTDFKTGKLAGIDVVIIEKLKAFYGYRVVYEKYNKEYIYDCIMGGVVKSDELLQIFENYNFFEYYQDKVVIYVRKDSDASFQSFISLYKHDQIGILLYTYGYYLLKDTYKNARYYAYPYDLLTDLQENKIQYAIFDEMHINLDEKTIFSIKKIKDLYSESIGLLYLKENFDIVDAINSIFSQLNKKELFQWSK